MYGQVSDNLLRANNQVARGGAAGKGENAQRAPNVEQVPEANPQSPIYCIYCISRVTKKFQRIFVDLCRPEATPQAARLHLSEGTRHRYVHVPIPTAARAAPHQRMAHVRGPRDGDANREGGTRAQTRVLHQSAVGLTAMLGPVEGGRKNHALVSGHESKSYRRVPPRTWEGRRPNHNHKHKS